MSDSADAKPAEDDDMRLVTDEWRFWNIKKHMSVVIDHLINDIIGQYPCEALGFKSALRQAQKEVRRVGQYGDEPQKFK